MGELQTIPARHGVATFVPAGQIIKIVNSSGTQVIDTWAFALPAPDGKKGEKTDEAAQGPNDTGKAAATPPPPSQPNKPSKTKRSTGKDFFPSQEDAERATREGLAQAEAEDKENQKPKSSWSSYVPNPSAYVPSLGFGGSKNDAGKAKEKNAQKEKKAAGSKETQQQKNSRTWASYFPSGKGFSSYIPKQATDTVSQFAASHQRDPSKSYIEQLQDFSKTPVGAAGLKGLAAMTGSGYGGSLYAGYSAFNNYSAANRATMEVLSMMHTREEIRRLGLEEGDKLVTNLRQPILTLVENRTRSGGGHDVLLTACDPQRYASEATTDGKDARGTALEERGSCAENLVLALKELNERAGLKGSKAVGADVSINSVPAPLGLFRKVHWDTQGALQVSGVQGGRGDFVRLKAERDVVVVMSACPMDDGIVEDGVPADAQFLVEEAEEEEEDVVAALKRTQAPRKKVPPKKLAPKTGNTAQVKKNPIPSKPPPPPPASKKVPAKKATSTAPQSTPGMPVKKTSSASSPPLSSRPKKKPIPPAVVSSRSAEDADDNEVPAVEKKKPRKLVRAS